jgi:radical SAM protein with 4Fe4S-binding SPASM domain
MRGAEILHQCGVPLRVGLVVMKQNWQYADEALAWLKATFGDIMVSTDVIRCTAGGRCQADLLTSELWRKRLRTTASFPKVSLEKFAGNKSGHPCLKGEVCVQSDGRVYPCIMDREHVLGNITASDLGKVIAGKAAQSIWGLSKDRIPVCRDCEYRYACSDCPPAAEGITGSQSRSGALTKDPFCLYDPYKGEWADAEGFLEKLGSKSELLQSK